MIKLALNTQRRILKKKFRPLHTTFLTVEGPAVGTIWFDKDMPRREPVTVTNISNDIKGRPTVYYDDDGSWDTVEAFLKCAKEGRYILIGVKPPHPHSHVEA